jgi:outer membrane protein TolC
VKVQQLFHSFLPGVTAAVLTTQPTLASTVKISGVQLTSVPSPVTSSYDARFSATGQLNQQLSTSRFARSSALVRATDLTKLSLNNGRNGTEGSWRQSLAANHVSPPSQQLLHKNESSFGRPSQIGELGTLAEGAKCSQVNQHSQAALLLATPACFQSTTPVQLLAQTTVPTVPSTTTPAPTSAPATREIPETLKANPNPLQFPTKPEEVRVQANQPITLSQALEVAKRNNNDLQESILDLERAKSAVREAQAALLPNLGLEGRVTNRRSTSSTLQVKRQRQSGFNAPDAQAESSFDGQAQLNYDLYTSGRRQAAIQQAEEQVRRAELAVETRAEEIRLNVARNYYDLQQADEEVRIRQSAVGNAQASLRDAQALERAGVGTRFDVLRSQVNLANAQQNLTNALSQQETARRRLAALLNIPQSVNISAADPVKLAGLWNQTLEESIVLAYQNRGEIQDLLVQRNISELQRRQALAALGPQISLFATYDLLDVFNDNVSVADGYSLGVRATLSLYDGGAAKARAAQAKSNIAIAETRFSQQRNEVRFQVEQAFSSQRSSLENVQTANAALEQARESLRLARLRFQAGVGTQTDVINAENDLTQAEGNRIRAILDYNRALVQLQRSVTFRALNK